MQCHTDDVDDDVEDNGVDDEEWRCRTRFIIYCELPECKDSVDEVDVDVDNVVDDEEV